MSFPPTPGSPGQPPYGNQPGSNSQQSGYPGASPGWNGAGQFGAPNQYSAGYFASGQSAYPGQGNYPGGPQRSKTGLIVALSALGVLLVGGVITLILILTDKEDAAPVAAAPTTSNASKAPASSAKKPGGIPAPGGGSPSTPGNPGQVPPGSGAGGQSPMNNLTNDFITKINTKDSAGAKAMLCQLEMVNIPELTQTDLDNAATNIQSMTDKGVNIPLMQMTAVEEMPGVYLGLSEVTLDGRQRGLAIAAYDGSAVGKSNSCMAGIDIEP